MNTAQVLTAREELGASGCLATVTLRHPGKLNAITVGMWRALRETYGAAPSP